MASIPLPSLNLSAKLSPFSLSFTARNNLVFNLSAVKFTPLKSNRRSKKYVCRAASVVFHDLDADDFRHPLDRQNTLLLRAIPGLNDIGKALLGTVAEQVMLLENIGTSVLVAEKSAP
ncbi:Peptidase family M48 family protein [Abeliophyllum distichum]|uniref:Peptidase family M48 family protein n=1 Tax=Abeliophyllum distichum TaxID=126358 RepID=A0ABD1SHG7_9LAMI